MQRLPEEDAPHVIGADVYLTNGAFLYRIVRVDLTGKSDAVELEDCYGLDVVSVSVDDLRARRLRVVVPTGTPTPGSTGPRSKADQKLPACP